jgi:hypothetical protein
MVIKTLLIIRKHKSLGQSDIFIHRCIQVIECCRINISGLYCQRIRFLASRGITERRPAVVRVLVLFAHMNPTLSIVLMKAN